LVIHALFDGFLLSLSVIGDPRKKCAL
jgi:hypothetical protein